MSFKPSYYDPRKGAQGIHLMDLKGDLDDVMKIKTLTRSGSKKLFPDLRRTHAIM
jgi:hypothetical protein